MKNIIHQLNKHFENRIRLGIMSALIVNDWLDFNSLKTYLEVTDGNLASHLAALDKHNYVEYKKEFVGRKPKTSYRITHLGRTAFQDHISALESLIKGQ